MYSLHTAEKLGLEVHGVEGVGGLIVVRLDLTYSETFLVSASSREAQYGFRLCHSTRAHNIPSGISSSPLLSAMIAVELGCGGVA